MPKQPALLDSAKSLSKRLSTVINKPYEDAPKKRNALTVHQMIIRAMRDSGFAQPHVIQLWMKRLYQHHMSESSLTRRLRELKALGHPIEMKRANKSSAACVYRLRRS